MMNYGERLRQLRLEKGLSQQELANRLKINRSTYARYELGKTQPDFETVSRIADFFAVSTDYILGRSAKKENDWDSKLPELTEKDERDIAKDLEKMISNLEKKEGYSQFDGQSLDDMDEEDRELLIASLENSMRLAKRIAKQKFTPKKFRK